MAADVTTIYRYQAFCRECSWWSEEMDGEGVERAADEHDEEHHPTASAGLAGTEGES